MFYESPLQLLEDTKAEIEKDIEWYANPNPPYVSLTREYRRKRVETLKKELSEYERAISILKRALLE